MTPRETVFNQINHRETAEVPYTLSFENTVGQRLDAHYGNATWRSQITPYIVGVGAVDTDLKERIDEKYVRDGYGGIWRQDMRPWHLEKPPLPEPTFHGYTFPPPESFFRPDWKETAIQTCKKSPDSFRIGHLGWVLVMA